MHYIDLIYASISILPKVWEVSILPQGISDHAPQLFCLHTGVNALDQMWQLAQYS